ncbi:translocation/assembly module TamB domain-containing protein [Desulfocurvus vexinensis]|uniref:translocation/assembly module TamB domain-containing protein n=1 Tax=Desulfocurvus vexinensis TaxID=399548 RepID=UPI0012EB6B90|nr:translocation/assembly module TamB domain-containing protein [Desulfocurvus vexinensis]
MDGRRVLRMAGLAAAALGALLAAAAWLATTRAGGQALARALERATRSQQPYALTVEELDLGLGGTVRARRVALADAGGPWLEVRELAVDVSLGALLAGRLELPRAGAALVRLERLPGEDAPPPAAAAPPQPAPQAGGGLAGLPAMHLGALDVARLELGAGAVGAERAYALAASAQAGPRGLGASARVRGLGEAAEGLDLAAAFNPARGTLELRLEADDPAGVLARLAELPGGAARLRLELAGPLAALRGGLDAGMDGVGALRGELTARAGTDQGPGMDFAGRVALDAGLLPAELERVLGREAGLAGTAALDGARLLVHGLTLGLGAGELTITGEADLDSGHLDWRAEAGPGLVLAAAREAGVALDTPGPLTLRGRGPLGRTSLEAEASARALAWDVLTVDGPALTATATVDILDGLALDAGARGQWTGLGLDGWPLGPGTARAALCPEAPDGELWQVHEAVAELPGVGAVLDGTGTLAGAGATARLRLALADLGRLHGAPALARGAVLDLDVELATGGADGWSDVRMDCAGQLRPGPGLPAPLAALLGPQAALRGTLAVDAARLALDGASLKSRTLTLDFAGSWGLDDDALALAARAQAPALALAPGSGGPLALRGLALDLEAGGDPQAGTARARWTLDGADLPGAALRGVSGNATARGPWTALALELALRAGARLDALAPDPEAGAASAAVAADDVSASAAAGAPGRAEAAGAAAATATGAPADGPWLPLALNGHLVWNPGAQGLDGDLHLAQEEPVAALRALDARAVLAATSGGQRVDLEARAGGLHLGAASLGAAELACRVEDALGAPVLDGTLELDRVEAAGLRLDTARAAVQGPPGALAFTARGAGAAGGPLELDLSGTLALVDTGGELRLASARGLWAGQPLALGREALLAWDGPGWRLAGLDATLGPGGLRADAAMDGQTLDLDARARALPLGPLLTLHGLPLAGGLDATLRASGPAAAPQATLRASGTLRAAPRELAAPVPDVTFNLHGDADQEGTRLTLALDAGNGTRLDAEAGLPLRPDATLPGLAPGPGGLHGFARGRLDLALAEALLGDEEQRLSGVLDLDATLGGSWERPRATGTARLDGARYEHTGLGLILDALRAEAEFQNESVFLRSLSATDGGPGRLEASGRWTPGAAPAYALRIVLRQATMLRHRLVTTTADGTLDLVDGDPLPVLRGHLVLPATEVRIPDELPGAMPELEVREVNAPEGLERTATAAPSGPPLALDVRLDVPGRFHVRGRGLEVEFRGAVAARGTTAAPALDGQLATVRGTFRFLDRVFDIATGTLLFSAASPVPDLDVEAGTSVSDTAVTATLQGPADRFVLALESDPALPRDEIISRLLFGRSMASLSPVQAFQLASALRHLSGGGGGFDPVGGLRALTGLDQLGVSQGEDGAGMRVGAGKYVHERVYLELQHDTGTGEDSVTVDVELTPDIGATGKAGASDGGVGVYWKKDY